MSSEGDAFEVDFKVAKMSELVKTMIDDDTTAEDGPQEVPLPNVKNNVLAKVIEFCRHHQEEPMTVIEKPLNIVNDFTPEEEAQVREENKWCENYRENLQR